MTPLRPGPPKSRHVSAGFHREHKNINPPWSKSSWHRITSFVDNSRLGLSRSILEEESIRAWIIDELSPDDPLQEKEIINRAIKRCKEENSLSVQGPDPMPCIPFPRNPNQSLSNIRIKTHSGQLTLPRARRSSRLSLKEREIFSFRSHVNAPGPMVIRPWAP